MIEFGFTNPEQIDKLTLKDIDFYYDCLEYINYVSKNRQKKALEK